MRFYLAAGSNINPAETLKRAIGTLAQQLCITRVSTFYQATPPGMIPGTPPYITGMLAGNTELMPTRLWRLLKLIEKKYGRKKKADKFVSRTLDLDLVLYGNWILKTQEMTIPDQDIPIRDYLSFPLYELEPDIMIPGMDRNLGDMLPANSTIEPQQQLTSSIRCQVDIYKRVHLRI